MIGRNIAMIRSMAPEAPAPVQQAQVAHTPVPASAAAHAPCRPVTAPPAPVAVASMRLPNAAPQSEKRVVMQKVPVDPLAGPVQAAAKPSRPWSPPPRRVRFNPSLPKRRWLRPRPSRPPRSSPRPSSPPTGSCRRRQGDAARAREGRCGQVRAGQVRRRPDRRQDGDRSDQDRRACCRRGWRRPRSRRSPARGDGQGGLARGGEAAKVTPVPAASQLTPRLWRPPRRPWPRR